MSTTSPVVDPSSSSNADAPVSHHQMQDMLNTIHTQTQAMIQQSIQQAFRSFQQPQAHSAASPAAQPTSSPSHHGGVGPQSSFLAVNRVKISPPSSFSGSRQSLASTWIFEMENYLDACAVVEEQRITVATSYLKDAALLWWKSQVGRPGAPLTWLAFKTALAGRFQPLAASKTARAELHALRQGNMSLSDYCTKFYNLLNLIPDMADADQVDAFVRGLRSDLARLQVGMQSPQTVNAAMTAATQIDLIIANHTTTTRSAYRSTYYTSPSGSTVATSSSSMPSTAMELGNANAEACASNELAEDADDFEQQEYQRYLEQGDDYEPDYEQWQQQEQMEREEEAGEAEQLQAMQQQQRRPAFNRPFQTQRQQRPYIPPEEFSRCMREGLCLKCKQPGHVSRDCSLPSRPPPPPPRRPFYSNRPSRFPQRSFQ